MDVPLYHHFCKNCLLRGQEHTCSWITHLFICFFVTMPKWPYKKMVVDCVLVIKAIGKTASDQTEHTRLHYTGQARPENMCTHITNHKDIVDTGCGSCICYYLFINNYYLLLFLCRSDQPGMWHVTWTILYLIFGREWWPHKATQSKIPDDEKYKKPFFADISKWCFA